LIFSQVIYVSASVANLGKWLAFHSMKRLSTSLTAL
jgi:hypothetical protein